MSGRIASTVTAWRGLTAAALPCCGLLALDSAALPLAHGAGTPA